MGGRGIKALTVVEVAVQGDMILMMMKGNKQVVGGEIILLHTHVVIKGGDIRHPQEDKEEEEEGVALEVVIVEVDPIAVVVLTCQKEVEEGRGGVAMMIWMLGVVVVGKMDAIADETEGEAQEVEVV